MSQGQFWNAKVSKARFPESRTPRPPRTYMEVQVSQCAPGQKPGIPRLLEMNLEVQVALGQAEHLVSVLGTASGKFLLFRLLAGQPLPLGHHPLRGVTSPSRRFRMCSPKNSTSGKKTAHNRKRAEYGFGEELTEFFAELTEFVPKLSEAQ